MELDKRIKKGKRPLTCFDTEQAKEFFGKQCYFANNIEDFSNLDNANVLKGFLTDIDEEMISGCFKSTGFRLSFFGHFIVPCEWVKPEKKYRAFTLAEWIDQYEIGDIIHYRSKSGEIELRHMYVGTRHSQGIKKIIVKITLGDVSHTLDYLFEDYEIEVNGEWQPFGVLEE